MSVQLVRRGPVRVDRTMRAERLVTLRSRLPLGLVTLRHDIPQHLKSTTPKVAGVAAGETPPDQVDETTARKGGEAR